VYSILYFIWIFKFCLKFKYLILSKFLKLFQLYIFFIFLNLNLFLYNLLKFNKNKKELKKSYLK